MRFDDPLHPNVVSARRRSISFLPLNHSHHFVTYHSHLSFRRFTPQLEYISDRVEVYLRAHFHRMGILVGRITSAVLIAYLESQLIPPHRDNVYDDCGNFSTEKNCQARHTASAILALGEGRTLVFELYKRGRRGGKDEKAKGENVRREIRLEHGSLFVLHPKDEESVIRQLFDSRNKTFFKHSSDGVKGAPGVMSLGVVLRMTVNSHEVEPDTGKLVMRHEVKEEKTGRLVRPVVDSLSYRERFAEEEVFLEERLSAGVEVDEKRYRRAWDECKKQYFKM